MQKRDRDSYGRSRGLKPAIIIITFSVTALILWWNLPSRQAENVGSATPVTRDISTPTATTSAPPPLAPDKSHSSSSSPSGNIISDRLIADLKQLCTSSSATNEGHRSDTWCPSFMPLLDTANRLATKERLKKDVDALLSCGSRVGGSDSPGYKCAAQFLLERLYNNGGAPDQQRQQGVANRFPFVPLSPPSGSGSSSGSSPHRWSVTTPTYEMRTPLGRRNFTNFCAVFPGTGSDNGHLVLAAHWDSKRLESLDAGKARAAAEAIEGEASATTQPFLGATDSAVPVVILLDVMKTVTAASSHDHHINLPKITLVFFDGEEALVEWKGTDNTYGARAEAAAWASRGEIRDITTFLLLDLIGDSTTTMHNFYTATTGQYTALQRLEKYFALDHEREKRHWRRWPRAATGAASLVADYNDDYYAPNLARRPYFGYEPKASKGRIADDHEPFEKHGVPILHLISAPFPPTWHQLADDGDHLHYDAIYECLRVLTEYTLQYRPRGAEGLQQEPTK